MNRRRFLQETSGAIAGSVFGSCISSETMERSESSGAVDKGPITAAIFEKTRKYFDTRFGRIAFVERGSGDAVVFLHGFPLNGFQWRGAIERLSPFRRCLAPDFLAMGYTEVRDGQSVDPDAQTEMIIAFLEALSIPSTDIVANDSGGAVAQLLVVRYPERITSLLLTNCDTEFDSPPPALLPVIEMSKAGTYVDQWLVPWLADKHLARSNKGIGGMCYVDPAHPTDEAIEYYFAPLVATARRKSLVHQYAIALERNPLLGIEAQLQRSRVPTSIVWGDGDTIFSATSPRYLNRTFGNSQGLRLLAGSKLFWQEERPDVIAEEARRLWKARKPETKGA